MKRHFVSLIIGCLLLGIGAAYTAVDFYNYDYINKLPSSNIISKVVTLNESFDGKKIMVITYDGKASIKESSDIEVGKARIEISYYDLFGSLDQNNEETSSYKIYRVSINPRHNNWEETRRLVDLGIDNLKDKKIYNYSWYYRPVITVYVNTVDKDNVKIDNY